MLGLPALDGKHISILADFIIIGIPTALLRINQLLSTGSTRNLMATLDNRPTLSLEQSILKKRRISNLKRRYDSCVCVIVFQECAATFETDHCPNENNWVGGIGPQLNVSGQP